MEEKTRRRGGGGGRVKMKRIEPMNDLVKTRKIMNVGSRALVKGEKVILLLNLWEQFRSMLVDIGKD